MTELQLTKEGHHFRELKGEESGGKHIHAPPPPPPLTDNLAQVTMAEEEGDGVGCLQFRAAHPYTRHQLPQPASNAEGGGGEEGRGQRGGS